MIRKVLGGLVLAFLLLAVFEGALSIGVIVYRDIMFQQNDWYVLSSDLGWVNRPRYAGDFFERGRNPRVFDDRGFVSVDAQQLATDNNHPRIVAIGDSSTFGWGVRAEATFTEVLDKQLPDFDVINLGVLGYSSFQGSRKFLKEGLALNPALIIASFNFNDRRAVPSARDIDNESTFTRYVMATRLNAVKQLFVSKALTRVFTRLGFLQTRDRLAQRRSLRMFAPFLPESLRRVIAKTSSR